MEFISPSRALLTLLAAVFASFLYRLYYARTRFHGLPQPPHSFLWGHLKVMGEVASQVPSNCHPLVYITEIARRYDLKGIWYLDLWPIGPAQVILTEPELMDQVQVFNVRNKHHMGEKLMAPLVGKDNIATANGPAWKWAHKAIAPAFSWSHIRGLTGVMVEEALTLRTAWERFAESGQVFSFERIAGNAIFDIIGRVTINEQLHAQTQGSQYLDDLRALIHLSNDSISMNPFHSLRSFFLRIPLWRRLNASLLKSIKERLRLLREQQIVPSRKDPFSIMDLMLRETIIQDEETKGKNLVSLDAIPKEELRLTMTNIKALLLGGLSTTIDTLCWTMMLLAKNPEVLQRLRGEMGKVFPPNLEETLKMLEKSPEKLGELEYTKGAIKEALRLFPVSFGTNEGPKDDTLNYQGRDYPIGDLMIVSNWNDMHYNERYFPEPEAFRPERHMYEGVPRGWFRSFSRGTRKCAGENLAIETLKVLLLLSVRDFEFELAGLRPNPNPKIGYSALDTIYGDIVFPELAMEARPRGGMMMTVKKLDRTKV
ncbi:Cytochrome P450 monooxygenase ptmG [Paramyrothecium foliicola]|nr:Cytochrome P450 monooxygenase ptmG [Paramyrothecium foliicola]